MQLTSKLLKPIISEILKMKQPHCSGKRKFLHTLCMKIPSSSNSADSLFLTKCTNDFQNAQTFSSLPWHICWRNFMHTTGEVESADLDCTVRGRTNGYDPGNWVMLTPVYFTKVSSLLPLKLNLRVNTSFIMARCSALSLVLQFCMFAWLNPH